MELEDNIFRRYYVDFNKLKSFGFVESNLRFRYEQLFMENQFRAVIEIDSSGIVWGRVFDVENEDEYLPLRVISEDGAFSGLVRAEYSHLLETIRDNCFDKKYYIFPQSNRITGLIIRKYKNEPEFLWEKFEGSGIFRNPDTQKWYAAILDVDRGKIQKGKSGIVEVIDLKLLPEKVKEIIKLPDFYEGYHMNKKYWISIILDESVSDEQIMELVEESHKLSRKNKK